MRFIFKLFLILIFTALIVFVFSDKIQNKDKDKQFRYSKKADFNEEVVKLFLNKQVNLNSKKFDKKLFKDPYILKSK